MQQPDPSNPMRIDIVSDVVCPWCIVGYRQLDRALARTGVRAQVRWHPFELNPDMPPEGQNLRDHLMGKYGITRDQSETARAKLTALGASLGFAFNFHKDSRMVNTFLAHQLIEWAEEAGRQMEVKLALFKAHFTDGRDVSDIDTLAQIAAENGLDAGTARQVLETGKMAFNVRGMQQFWQGKGIRGVPAMIFGGKHLLTGAQGEENYARALVKFAAEAA